MKNPKTTYAGIAVLLAAASSIFAGLAKGSLLSVDMATVIQAVSTGIALLSGGIIGVAAADGNSKSE